MKDFEHVGGSQYFADVGKTQQIDKTHLKVFRCVLGLKTRMKPEKCATRLTPQSSGNKNVSGKKPF